VLTYQQPSRPDFQAAVTRDGCVYVALSGDLDITTTAALAGQLARLAGMRPARLVIDMSGVSFLDCGSARLLASSVTFLPPGQQPVLISVRPAVRRLLELTGLAAILTMLPPA
jgi:anti-anti-sigma factor